MKQSPPNALSASLDADDLRELRKSAVDNLERLYTLVAGLSLAAAVTKLITAQGSPGQGPAVSNVWRIASVEFHYDTLPMFVAFVITLVPFYHGANRYLFATYVFRDSKRAMQPLSAMLDFAFFFVMALVFFAMSLVLPETLTFFWMYVGLLTLDCFWLIYVRRNGAENFKMVRSWYRINVATIAIVVPILFAEHIGLKLVLPDGVIVDSSGRSIVLMLIAVARTVLDYKMSLPVYWPGFHEPKVA